MTPSSLVLLYYQSRKDASARAPFKKLNNARCWFRMVCLRLPKQTELNLQEYDGPQRKATVSICFVVFVYLCGITIHHLDGLRICTELGALGAMKYIRDRMFFWAKG